MYSAPILVEYGDATQLIQGTCGLGTESGFTKTQGRMRTTRYCDGEENCLVESKCLAWDDPFDCTYDWECWS
jgi:hypothetical protein